MSKHIPKLLTEQEVAERLGVGLTFLHGMRRRAKVDPLPYFKIGGAVRYSEEEVYKWLERRAVRDPHEAAMLKRSLRKGA